MRRALLTLTVIGLAAYLIRAGRKALDKPIDDATEGFGLDVFFPFHAALNTTEEQ